MREEFIAEEVEIPHGPDAGTLNQPAKIPMFIAVQLEFFFFEMR
jgi:hypothetical protein